jgi:hypothetical protein
MKKTVLYFLIIPLVAFSQSKVIDAKLYQSISIIADDFIGYDSYDFCYYISNNVLFKKQNEKIFQYQNLQYGKITKVDIVNPLRILIFYENFNAVVLIDNQFNEIQTILFSELENPTIVSAIGTCGQNKLWLYNSLTQQIELFDIITNTSKAINVPIKEKFLFYQTDLNYFQWIDANFIWHISNIYGNIKQNGKINSIENLQIINSDLIIFKLDKEILLKNIYTKNEYKIENIENSFEKMFYKDQILSIFTNHLILRYKIILP